MNKRTILGLAMLGAMAVTGVKPAAAQDKVRASIPFAFNVGAKALPAGDYDVQRLSTNTMMIQEVNSHEAAMAITSATDPRNAEGKVSLVFNRYGEDNFLSQILTPDSGRVLLKSKLEQRSAARAAESAENQSGPRVIYVAASLH